MVNPASGLPRPYPNLDAASSAAPLDSLPSEAYTILPVGLASRLARLRLTLQVQKQTFSDADETSSEHKVRFGSWHVARVSRPFSPPVDNCLAADGRRVVPRAARRRVVPRFGSGNLVRRRTLQRYKALQRAANSCRFL